jgi:hypothetical protein
MEATVSSSATSRSAGRAPIWRIQASTPWPKATVRRPGCRRAAPAISMAASAGLRNVTGSRPMPTSSPVVAASAATAIVGPPARKQSSTTHSSLKPSRSAARANAGRSSGGHSGRNRTPTRGTPS